MSGPIMHWTNVVSRLTGRFADTRFPRPVQRLVNFAYARATGADLAEFAPLASYPSLNALFTRRLVTPRVFDAAADTLIAPADSSVQGFGRLRGDQVLQVKGLEYSVRALLTGHARHADAALDGAYLSLYLSPRVYHGYHAPAALLVDRLIHVPGRLLPVNAVVANRRPGLFAVNERVILEGRRLSGQRVWMVFVGATNVGSITFALEPELHTNTGVREPRVYECGGRLVGKGEYLGSFRMGSAILLFAETRDPAPASLGVSRLRFGDPLPWPPGR
jgi:phosphatidylserine decarboxylase